MNQNNPIVVATSKVFQALPPFKGKTRLIRILNRTYLTLGADPMVLCALEDDNRFVVDLRSRTEAVPCYLGTYDRDTHNLIKDLVKPGWVALDVGANIGFISVPLAKKVGGTGKLFCFEPLPSNFERLRENLKLNEVDGQIRCFQIALSDDEGDLRLGLFGDFEHGGTTGNAVPMAKGQPSPFKEVLVKKITLDSWVERENLGRLDFIKIDIEGHEDRFIDGAKKTLKKFRPYILGEFSENHMAFKGIDVDEFYKKFSQEFNYAAYSFTGGKRTPIDSLKGRQNFEDVLFAPL